MWNNDEIVYSYRLLNSKIRMPFIVFMGYQKYRKNEIDIAEKCSGVSILFEPYWTIYIQWLQS